MIERKHVHAEIKAIDDKRPGYFKALAAVFGNVDSVGDRIVPGAFKDDLNSKGGVLPCVWSHEWSSVPIGVQKAYESSEGLVIEGQLLIDDNAKAREVYAAFKAGVPLDFSFAYEVLDSREAKAEGKTIRELVKLATFEAGPTLIGANRLTELQDVKAAHLAGSIGAAEAIRDLVSIRELTALLTKSTAPGSLQTAPTAPVEPDPDEQSEDESEQDDTPTSPGDTPAPDPAEPGSPTTEDDDAEVEPEQVGDTRAEAARYLATPVA